MRDARLLNCDEGRPEIDYSQLLVLDIERLRDLDFDPDFTPYASSGDGWLFLTSGGKTHAPLLRLESWSGKPPLPEGFEEYDEIPLTLTGRRLAARNERDEESVRVPVGQAGRFRVRVVARGRHADSCGKRKAPPCPEAWLVQFWPNPDPADALSMGPRVLLGPDPWNRSDIPVFSRHLDWHVSGWSLLFHSTEPYKDYWLRLLRLGRAATREELVGGELERAEPAYSFGRNTAPGLFREHLQATWNDIDELASQLGVPPIHTRDDALNLLLRTGVWTSETIDGVEFIGPNPHPPLMHHVLTFTPDRERYVREQIARGRGAGAPASDIVQLLRWAPNGLHASLQQLAERLALSPTDIAAGLDLLVLQNTVRVAPGLQNLTFDRTVHIAPVTD